MVSATDAHDSAFTNERITIRLRAALADPFVFVHPHIDIQQSWVHRNSANITFDPARSRETAERRGFGFEVVEGFDWATALYNVDARQDYGEVREVALGLIDDLVFVMVFTRRGGDLHIISVRRANRKERVRYGQI